MKDELREKLQDMSKASMEAGIPIMGNIITDAVIGQAVPGVATAVISYKQKRTERMLIKAIDELKKQMIAINEKVNNMDKEQITFIKERKTLEDLEGRITKPKKSATDISKLGIYLIEFFKMYKKEDDNHE